MRVGPLFFAHLFARLFCPTLVVVIPSVCVRVCKHTKPYTVEPVLENAELKLAHTKHTIFHYQATEIAKLPR